ncbi:MAG TPA: hypothetical protein IAC84_00975 [Firmicutes bacterium]|nr:hypothetical protein [Bacillota bacterium]
MVDYLERLLDQDQGQDEEQEEPGLLEERLSGMIPRVPLLNGQRPSATDRSSQDGGDEGQTAAPSVQTGPKRQSWNWSGSSTSRPPSERSGVPERLLAQMERRLTLPSTGLGEEGRPAQGAPGQGALDQGVPGQAVLGPGLAAAHPLLPVPAQAGWEAAAGPPSAGGDGGLRRLYRQVRAASWEQSVTQTAGVAVRRETAMPQQSGLTMGQLDRAMRRDSRRYDGGMSIY